jgi:hypothetical protein
VLRVRTTAAAGDTAVARMAALVAQATGQQSPAEALVARVGARGGDRGAPLGACNGRWACGVGWAVQCRAALLTELSPVRVLSRQHQS